MKTPKLEQRGTPIQIDPQRGETIEMKVRRITQNINLKLKQIVKDSYCTCCFECDNVINSSISIP